MLSIIDFEAGILGFFSLAFLQLAAAAAFVNDRVTCEQFEFCGSRDLNTYDEFYVLRFH